MSPTYRILHRDDTLLVVDKAPGVLTVGHPGTRGRCVLDDLRRDGHKVAPVHRLDRETSGVLLLCLDPARRDALETAFRRHEVEKTYFALVAGVPAPPRATIDVPILDEGAAARVDRRGQRAVSHYVVREKLPGRRGGAALVEVCIDTGRHNQIRLHMAHAGHPLLGDRKYGARAAQGTGLAGTGRRTSGAGDAEAPRTMLHAATLALRHPVGGRMLRVEAPLPEDFLECLQRLRA